jgi:hypothetical protein
MARHSLGLVLRETIDPRMGRSLLDIKTTIRISHHRFEDEIATLIAGARYLELLRWEFLLPKNMASQMVRGFKGWDSGHQEKQYCAQSPYINSLGILK